ncbi:MAG: hypothetical protein QOI10_3550 [Solirubrobacterales bacterium]|jgi:hypothetical protein|nr:hypothetical protein [Solirubrobacterales bacterium]
MHAGTHCERKAGNEYTPHSRGRLALSPGFPTLLDLVVSGRARLYARAVRIRRLTREDRAERIEAEAALFERQAAEMEQKLPADLIESEPVSDAEAKKLRASDPVWQRHAAAGLRRSASELRALAERKRRGDW